MASGDLYQLTMKWDVNGQPMNNVCHWLMQNDSGSFTDAETVDLISEKLSDDVVSDYLPDAPAALDWNGVEGFIVNKPTVAGGFAINTNGTTAANLLPLRSSVVSTKVTGLRGRSYRGRFFLPPPGEDVQDEGVITGAYITVINGFLQALRFIGDGAGNSWQMAVYSPTLSPDPETAFVASLVSDFITRPVLGSQRGRQVVA